MPRTTTQSLLPDIDIFENAPWDMVNAPPLSALHSHVVFHRLTQLLPRFASLASEWEPFYVEKNLSFAMLGSSHWSLEFRWHVQSRELYKNSRTDVRELLLERFDSDSEPSAADAHAVATEVNARKSDGWESQWRSMESTLAMVNYRIYDVLHDELGLSVQHTARLVRLSHCFVTERWMFDAASVQAEWLESVASSPLRDARERGGFTAGLAKLK